MESKQSESSILIQKNIKENTEQLQDFIADLKSWEEEIKEVDNKLSTQSNNKDRRNVESSIPPVRSKSHLDPAQFNMKQTQKKQATNKNNNNSKKAKRMPRDYAAWDKFDFDKALESAEEEDEDSLSNFKPTLHTPSANKKERANALKEEGNKLYGKGRLEDAVAKYTQGMALDPTNPLLSANRAMAYIKLEKYQAAEADCNKCLKLDCNYLKGYLRRATARIHLGKEELARRDCLKVLEMEPGNKEAKKELEKLQAKSLSRHEETKRDTAQTHSQEEEHIQTPSYCVKSRGREGSEGKEGTPHKGKGKGKRLKIVEVDSSKDERQAKPNEILPIEKPPHLRSKKPLVKIPVVDVGSEEEMNKRTAVEVKEDKSSDGGGSGGEGRQKDKEERIAKPTKMDECVSSKAFVSSVPRTSHQFTQVWQRLSKKDEAARDYLKMIPSTFFCNVDLEVNTMVEVVEALGSEGVPTTLAAQHLSALSVSHGFSINLMFLEEEQKQVLLSLTCKCKQVKSLVAEMEKLESMIESS